MALSENERKGEIAAIRAKLKSKPGSMEALNDAIHTSLSAQGINIDNGLNGGFVIALPEELADNLNQVTLPGGTNC
ncbi:hypothetical protein [Paracoccus sp. SSK6]|uniref:hypothetical protein n=1 Tax=Paracoccus sp. SSK6 TaxID=3143131 RepID=UPI00321B6ACF